jgi:hypothetical protein
MGKFAVVLFFLALATPLWLYVRHSRTADRRCFIQDYAFPKGLDAAAAEEAAVAINESREPLISSSHRRKPVSSALNFLDSGFRQNNDISFNQLFPKI